MASFTYGAENIHKVAEEYSVPKSKKHSKRQGSQFDYPQPQRIYENPCAYNAEFKRSSEQPANL